MTTEHEWHKHARELAGTIVADGVLTDPAWRAALEAVPRHVFVPRFSVQRADGVWVETTTADAGWLHTVYSDTPLVTALAELEDGRRVPLSSSTKPGLMVRMLEALDVHDGHRVLEIGTGTGYNAGLLSHRLGAAHVFSVEIEADLVGLARERLAGLGHTPTLVAGDGAAGLPNAAPYDRIIATCSVSMVPSAWAAQVRDGGLVLVDVKRGVHAGNLVLLRRIGNRLEGRFLPKWAGFMAMRDATGTSFAAPSLRVDLECGRRSVTRLDPRPWTASVPWFLAQLRLPRNITFGYRGAGPEWATFTGEDGSWCAVSLAADDEGLREVRQGGPVAIWDHVESVHELWQRFGRPGWDRLGLTVHDDGRHRVWLDDPDSSQQWVLPPLR
ncbi:methyltransferase domain-containing protein [Saccharomonospora xinjiangensis]|uniref:Protein-L-isoaspartate O-methyltransferase n=1 Tax=Saccharomonospora xinjiangensis XJ-54 TaxID=882086 RepID=I0V252_9PSEU|nr:methyltransferase domain-containing protein [Saccharomonospora xinjiangensis]EID54205.1 protein-L-isoaspartate carboxylmethyltransferase [Saccharomonospora xinjiangensis XJ-54]